MMQTKEKASCPAATGQDVEKRMEVIDGIIAQFEDPNEIILAMYNFVEALLAQRAAGGTDTVTKQGMPDMRKAERMMSK